MRGAQGLQSPHADDATLDDAVCARSHVAARAAASIRRASRGRGSDLPRVARSRGEHRAVEARAGIEERETHGARALCATSCAWSRGRRRSDCSPAARPDASASARGSRLTERGTYRRHSRLDMDYLFALCEHLARDPNVRAELLFRPNSSLYEAAGRLRFAESRVQGGCARITSWHSMRSTRCATRCGARQTERVCSDLATALVAIDPDGEITLEDAQAFLHDLVDNQLLVPDLAVAGDGRRKHGRPAAAARTICLRPARRAAHRRSGARISEHRRRRSIGRGTASIATRRASSSPSAFRSSCRGCSRWI